MKIIDFHLHLSPTADVSREKNISQEKDLMAILKGLSLNLRKNKIEKGLAIVLDQSFLEKDDLLKTLNKFDNLLFSFMIDFRQPNAIALLEMACSAKSFKGLKFHPTHQQITRDDFESAMGLAKKASDLNKIIIIDCHSVSSFSLELDFAKYILRKVKTPVILAHSGGLKALEALVVALDFENVYLETSFSVPFWLGSSIEQDLAYCFKKLGVERCLYGSDSPFMDIAESVRKTLSFLQKHNFSGKEINQIMSGTARSLI